MIEMDLMLLYEDPFLLVTPVRYCHGIEDMIDEEIFAFWLTAG